MAAHREPEMLRPVGAMRRARETLELFGRVGRNADLRRVILAWAASNLASRASAIAVAVFAYQAGGAGAVGIIAFVRLVSTALLAPVLGAIADRRSRRRVMIEVELVRGVLFGILAVLVASDVPGAVYLLAVIVAIAEPVFRSAQAAITPSLVSTPEELTASNVLASGVESVGLFLGPALGALVIAVTGIATVFWVSVGLVVVAIVLVARIGVSGEPSPEEQAGHRRSLLAGWQCILAEPDMRLVIGLFGFQALVAGVFNVLVVVLAIEVLDLGTAGVGFLDGMVGVGALLAVVVAAGATARGGLASTFAVGLLLWGVPLMLVAGVPVTAVVVPLLLLVGVGNTLVDVAGITLLQRSAPDAVLGRVFGAFESVIIGSLGIGALLAPALDAAFGPRGALLVAGAILPVVLLPSWRRLLGIDARGRVDEAALALLRAIPIFEPLPLPELERLALALGDTRVEGGVTVFEEGDLGDRFYVIRSGEAEVLIGGKRVRTLGPGQFFGEIALVRDVPRTATTRALTDLDLGTLERDVFVGTLSRHAASAEAVGSIVAARLPSPVIS
jgi:MFS family permease